MEKDRISFGLLVASQLSSTVPFFLDSEPTPCCMENTTVALTQFPQSEHVDSLVFLLLYCRDWPQRYSAFFSLRVLNDLG
jgi:hypothetical protein